MYYIDDHLVDYEVRLIGRRPCNETGIQAMSSAGTQWDEGCGRAQCGACYEY